MKRILVTRPEPGATRTTTRLENLGYAVIKLPLSHTVALNPAIASQSHDVVIATSANAFFRLDTTWSERLAGLPTYVVGDATAQAARNAGFKTVLSAGSDMSGLLIQLSTLLSPKSNIAYLCGRVRRPELEQELAARGIPVASIEVYDTESVSYSTDKLKEFLNTPIDAVMVSSVKNAGDFQQLAIHPKFSQHFDKSLIFCLSDRIAAQFGKAWSNRIRVSDRPDENAMVKLLQHHCPA